MYVFDVQFEKIFGQFSAKAAKPAFTEYIYSETELT